MNKIFATKSEGKSLSLKLKKKSINRTREVSKLFFYCIVENGKTINIMEQSYHSYGFLF
jgi:hypothetical protein